MKKEWKKPFVKWVILDPLVTGDIVGCSKDDPTPRVRLHGTGDGDDIFEGEW